MKVLIACEESQTVCNEFRLKGHEAYSCDIQSCSGNHPEWHIKSDVIPVLDGNIKFRTEDGCFHYIDTSWDLIIAHPPCTYLTAAATQCHSLKCFSDEYIKLRTIDRVDAVQFFLECLLADCPRICIENPRGIMSSIYRQPDQYIQPYYFASSVDDTQNYYTKTTGLWLKGLPPLQYECCLPKPTIQWVNAHHDAKTRSKTFPAIARAMAEQWG